MEISIAGTGYVGLVSGACLAEVGHSVICVDVDEEKVRMMESGKSPIYEADLEDLMTKNIKNKRLQFTTDYQSAYRNADVIFIGVGTPTLPDGSANLTYIANVARQIAETVERDCLVVVKSTVPVGVNDKVEQFIRDFLVHDVKIEVASSPEFLAQGTAVHDTLFAPRIIVGTESDQAKKKMEEIYAPFKLPIVFVSRRSAEMIKYAANSFLALKISYMNDIANLCEIMGADVYEVAHGMSYDDRIGSRFLAAGIGYGGSCFPKDTRVLEHLAQQNGHRLRTVEAAVHVNSAQKIRLFKKASERLISFKGLKVAVLGLTFKPGTDDLREAPSVDNMALLLEKGADILAYDPVGIDNCRNIYPEGKNGNGTVGYIDNPLEAISGANLCFIFTEWPQIVKILPELYSQLMQPPLVYDGRNIYSPEEMKACGVEYHCIGRGI